MSLSGTVDETSEAGSDWRDFSHPPLPPILDAALMTFIGHGYHGTTIRQLAAAAGLSVPGLYHHHASKQGLLVAICETAMADLWERSRSALAQAGDDVVRRLDLLTECLVLFHAHRPELAFIAANELRSLQADARETHIAARDRQQRLMDDVVVTGTEQGVFSTPYPRDVSRAVVTMCTGVAQWYRPRGELSPADLATRYVIMTRMTVGAPMDVAAG
ncbi:TetR/AcrR family transcriptional regulator [Nocardioides sp. NPDC058538]|uniref:TetR/AcrR family transcriptional regulator n=1 Tax=Nocardioides sp. NPDC058538 TaxID=3346542 RepID=UPI003664C960